LRFRLVDESQLVLMTLDLDDTIAAIATAPGGALRGVVRVSGPRSLACVQAIFPKAIDEMPAPSALGGEVHLPRNLGAVPARLYVWPGKRSYTRQPTVELHLPGAPPILDAVLEALCQAGARLARPGEFTLRAFLAGRLDLTQAEAVLGVIDARGNEQLQTALAQLAGGLAGPLAELRSGLLDLLAHLEAGLDFVDEDIEFMSAAELTDQLTAASQQVARLAERMRSRRDPADLPRVVLVGPPNAGKSSLFNALAGRDSAIVSPQAGTTRDYVTARLAIEGHELLLIDTAGEERGAAATSIAGQAQAAANRQQRAADITVRCFDTTLPVGCMSAAKYTDDHQLLVWTKCDRASPPESTGISTSSHTGAGLDDLRRTIAARLAELSSGAVASTAARCGESLDRAATALVRATELAALQAGEELVAAEVRAALEGLGEVAGAVYTDDILDRVFSRFCIGK
jgi:tRNA modification GTPase